MGREPHPTFLKQRWDFLVPYFAAVLLLIIASFISRAYLNAEDRED